MNVLLLITDRYRWDDGKYLSYVANWGMEDALKANGCNVTTIVMHSFNPYVSYDKVFDYIKSYVGDKKFDVVWVDIMHTQIPKYPGFVEYITSLAPVSVAYTLESVTTLPCHAIPLDILYKSLNKFTHVLFVDEYDINFTDKKVKTIFFTPSISEKFLNKDYKLDYKVNKVLFLGKVYYVRENIINNTKYHVEHSQSPEDNCGLSNLFDASQDLYTTNYYTGDINKFSETVDAIRNARVLIMDNYLEYIRNYLGFISLIGTGYLYQGRVFEGLAAKVPVLVARMPARQIINDMFNDDELLLYDCDYKWDDTQGDVLPIIETVEKLYDNDFRKRIVDNATRRLKKDHTSDVRVKKILNWVNGV